MYWHLFFDTSAIHSSTDYVNVSHLAGQNHYYVSQLCVEELAMQLLNAKDGIKEAYSIFKRFDRMVGEKLPPLHSDAVLLDSFRKKITKKLERAGCTIFEVYPHDPAEQLSLFMERYQGAYKDTMILASSIRHAAAKGLKYLGFVVQEKNKGLENFGQVAKILGEKYNVRTTLLCNEDLVDVLQITPEQIEEIQKLLTPKLCEKLLPLRRQLVDQALSNEFVFGPTTPEAVRQFRERFGGLDADLSPIKIRLVNATPFLNEPLKKGNTVHVEFRMMIVQYRVENLFSRLYGGIGEATIKYNGTSFSEARVTSASNTWYPCG